MTLLQVVVLALARGLAAFWPVSADAHLHLLPALFGWHFYGGSGQVPGRGFSATVALGSTAALVLYFWRELLHISVAWCRGLYDPSTRRSLEYRMGWYLIAVTVPAAVLGLVFDGPIRRGYDTRWLLAGSLIAVGITLWVADRFGRRSRVEERFGRRDAAAQMLAQVIALVPGASRAGCAVSAGLICGFERRTAVRFAFLLSVPWAIVSGVFSAVRASSDSQPGLGVGLTGLALVVSFGAGLSAVHLLLRWVRGHSLAVFAAYRVALGLTVIGLVAGGIWSASA